jgi:tetratricopeptide (TPR) repeat protein
MEEDPAQAAVAAQARERDAARPGSALAARRLFEQAVRLAPSNPEQAADLFEEAFQSDPSLTLAAYDAGVLRERQGDVTRARAAYLMALAVAPDFEPASQNLTRIRLRAGRAEEAESDLRARIAAHPGKPGLRNQLVELLLATGQLEGAEQESRRVLKMDERNVPALVNLATAYHQGRRYELARTVPENARQIDSNDATVWNRIGFVELALGNRPQALEAFARAASLRADYPEAHVNYGAMLVEAGDYAGAVREIEVAVRCAPTSVAARLNLGNAYRGARRFEEAQREYERVLMLAPSLADAWFNLGLLYLDGEKQGLATTERLEKSIAFFDRYASAGGKDPRLAQYRKDAQVALERERRRLARDERDKLRREAEVRKKEAAPAPATDGKGPDAPAGGTGGEK